MPAPDNDAAAKAPDPTAKVAAGAVTGLPPAFPPVHWRMAATWAAILTVLFAALAVPIGPAGASRFWTTLPVQALTWGLWLLLLPLVVLATRHAHEAGLATARGLATHLAAGCSLSLVHATAFAVLRWIFGMTDAENPGYVVSATVAFVLAGDFLRYACIAAAYHAAAYHGEATRRAVSEIRMAERLARARLEALEHRLQPHFLFNTLNSIGALIATDPAVATRMVEQLGELLRASLQARPGSQVPVRTELELLEQYTAIQRVRFSDRLHVDIRADPEALPGYVPQMILQPLVENAIRHGVAPKEGKGTVVIEARRRGTKLRMTVADDGVGFGRGRTRASDSGKGLGINHTRERLAAAYGDDFTMDIVPGNAGGTEVVLEVPFHAAPSAGAASGQ